VKILPVTYVQQIDRFSCGIAAFAMVYQHLRPTEPFSQQYEYNHFKELTPDRGAERVSADSIQQLANEKGLMAGWGQVDPNRVSEHLKFFIERELPLIAIQQWPQNRIYGHFRVIIGSDDDAVVFHDPEPGGDSCRLPLDQFITAWQPTKGDNVTGGVAIWIASEQIPDNPLGNFRWHWAEGSFLI
jgi:ABC-type bacteriocin/lantibiotic exporter with double-glycine peptidase domain